MPTVHPAARRLRPMGSSYDLLLSAAREDAPCLRMTSRTRLAISLLVTLADPAPRSVAGRGKGVISGAGERGPGQQRGGAHVSGLWGNGRPAD